MAQKRVEGLRGRHEDALADVSRGEPDAVAKVSCRGWSQEDHPVTPT